MASPTARAGMAHPEMAYSPVPASDHGDAPPDGKPIKWHFSPSAVVRLVAGSVLVAGIVVEAVCFQFPRAVMIIGIILQACVLGWHVAVLAADLHAYLGGPRRFVLRLGCCRLSCGDEDGGGGEEGSAGPPRKWWMRTRARQVCDAALGLVMLLGVIIEAANSPARRSYYWQPTVHRGAIIGLMVTTMCLQVLLVVMPYSKLSRSITCLGYVDDSDDSDDVAYSIRLPGDPRPAGVSKGVSITA